MTENGDARRGDGGLMPHVGKGKTPAPAPRRSLFPIAVVAVLAVGLAAFLLFRQQQPGQPVAWTRLGTADVHSLTFINDDPERVLFGHHDGLLGSSDGGGTWSAMPVRQDAMSTSAASDGSIVIAGHEVFSASRDGGATWAPIATDLPSLDIHGFTRDPADPARMWAYLAVGGLWESTDFGAHWKRVREDNVLYPVAVRVGEKTRLIGVDSSGLVASDDDGRTWTNLARPETYPLTALTGTAGGQVLLAGSPDALFRSDDGGRSWTRTAYVGSVFAVATDGQGKAIAVVSQETDFYRSGDGGATWPGP